jgi:hypothetical protein
MRIKRFLCNNNKAFYSFQEYNDKYIIVIYCISVLDTVAARQDQNRVGTSNFFGQFFRVIFFF